MVIFHDRQSRPSQRTSPEMMATRLNHSNLPHGQKRPNKATCIDENPTVVGKMEVFFFPPNLTNSNLEVNSPLVDLESKLTHQAS